MRTPSLGTRLVVAGVAVVAGLVVGVDVLLYVSVRSSLLDNLDNRLDSQAETVRALSREAAPPQLVKRLAAMGIQATVRPGDGSIVETYISYLRKKVDASEPRLIHTVRGVGYTLRPPA